MPDLPLDRIIRGDASHVLRQLPNNSVDLIVTDPPYGDNVSYGPRRVRIAGNENPLLALSVMGMAYRVLKRNSTAYMFCSIRHLDFVRAFFSRYTCFRARELIIWNKLTMNVGVGFRKQYECIIVLEKGKPAYRDPKMLNLLSVRRVRDPSHPHAKPVDLVKLLIQHSSTEGSIVLDPFAGTGTTAVAARELGRHFVGIELDANYCRTARARLGVKPVQSSAVKPTLFHPPHASVPLPQPHHLRRLTHSPTPPAF
jgi:DNA modification methylase